MRADRPETVSYGFRVNSSSEDGRCAERPIRGYRIPTPKLDALPVRRA